jgi:hypothetical protein
VPSPLHETLVDLFHRTPTMLRGLVGARLGVLARRGLGFDTDHTRVSQLRDVDTDLVLKVRARNGELLCAIVLEVQLSIKKSKARTWPLYPPGPTTASAARCTWSWSPSTPRSRLGRLDPSVSVT